MEPVGSIERLGPSLSGRAGLGRGDVGGAGGGAPAAATFPSSFWMRAESSATRGLGSRARRSPSFSTRVLSKRLSASTRLESWARASPSSFEFGTAGLISPIERWISPSSSRDFAFSIALRRSPSAPTALASAWVSFARSAKTAACRRCSFIMSAPGEAAIRASAAAAITPIRLRINAPICGLFLISSADRAGAGMMAGKPERSGPVFALRSKHEFFSSFMDGPAPDAKLIQLSPSRINEPLTIARSLAELFAATPPTPVRMAEGGLDEDVGNRSVGGRAERRVRIGRWVRCDQGKARADESQRRGLKTARPDDERNGALRPRSGPEGAQDLHERRGEDARAFSRRQQDGRHARVAGDLGEQGRRRRALQKAGRGCQSGARLGQGRSQL